MEGLFGFAPVAAITIICYLIAMGVKTTRLDNKYIPIVCGVLGAVLGIVALYTIAGYPASNILDAAAYGIASGLAATGLNQVVKQIGK